MDDFDDWTRQFNFADFGFGEDMVDRFREFNKENPHVLERLTDMALKLKRKGHKRVGIAMFFEVLRWEHMRKTTGDPFKLNNNFKAFYSRIIEKRTPELEGFFTKRQARADEEG